MILIFSTRCLILLLSMLTVVLSLWFKYNGLVNGQDVAPGEIPYQVSLQTEDESKNSVHFCSGSILNEYYVITTADCVTKYPDNGTHADFKIVAGTINLDRPGRVHEIERIITHEAYNECDWLSNNIALIKVSTPFELSHDIGFVTLPKQDEIVQQNTAARVSGYKILQSFQRLQQANIYIDQEYCNSYIIQTYNDTFICARDPENQIRLCSKELWGGPLIANGKLVGLILRGNCYNAYCPTLHVRVSSYINWIKKNMKSVKCN